MYSHSDFPDNSTCWFWVKDTTFEVNEDDAVCSEDVYCHIINQGIIYCLLHGGVCNRYKLYL